ncbi:hypothetical protein SAMN02949497_1054 [Methylomagnum ishizawai]|uniref:Uncharacterized protein n=1 Tax=Methylomagnum ishizawai TaxID=1760988 RepID=A0A1Y6CZM6_9GAMM|nr:cupin domain-containing protein [Methylomagnum ishizawai]SMF93762.1 hypothetical protein SAMN02949497_1054 [Methylomagnum ishizawai]
MSGIMIERLGLHGWPVWSQEPSGFPWTYDETESKSNMGSEAPARAKRHLLIKRRI